MRGSAIAASLVLSLALSAAPVFAQAAGQAKPAQTPAPPPAPAAPPAPAPGPPAPFPQGAKIAFFNPQVVFQASADGKAALARVNNLIQKKQKEAEDKAKMLQGNQQKLQTSGSVMNEAARSQLEKEIEKQQKDGERFQQDAQAEVQELQQEVQNEFVKKLSPIVNELATEKGLHIVFNAGEAGIAWAMAGLDLTGDVIKKLDAQAAKPATTPKE
ncbi:MAG TPA: OmpH family outer membrane protein [Vicinamibacterales bacterium]|jgi:Skp family chaperone for outer membrane proteins